ncbi:MAG: hypothetical protein JNK65_01170 [Deltaproteobacteria bacterium]|nr:hypothetical protein [Deltaproteobacteria bacterium]
MFSRFISSVVLFFTFIFLYSFSAQALVYPSRCQIENFSDDISSPAPSSLREAQSRFELSPPNRECDELIYIQNGSGVFIKLTGTLTFSREDTDTDAGTPFEDNYAFTMDLNGAVIDATGLDPEACVFDLKIFNSMWKNMTVLVHKEEKAFCDQEVQKNIHENGKNGLVILAKEPKVVCGNGLVEKDEVCDNNSGCCASDCKSFKSKTDSCDDKNANTSNDLCDGAGKCVGTPVSSCGNGKIEKGEVCDDKSGCCASDCKSFMPEKTKCDDGSSWTLWDSCNAQGKCEGTVLQITFDTCGNGKLDEGEECDVQNLLFASCCDVKTCKFKKAGTACNDWDESTTSDQCLDGGICKGLPAPAVAFCGDGKVDAGEACDDKNTQNNDGCSSDCKIETGHQCGGEPSVCKSDETPVCGNGKIETGEECDGGDCCDNTCHAEQLGTVCHDAQGRVGECVVGGSCFITVTGGTVSLNPPSSEMCKGMKGVYPCVDTTLSGCALNSGNVHFSYSLLFWMLPTLAMFGIRKRN